MKKIFSILLTATLIILVASCQKTKEQEVPVASVSLNKIALSLLIGETQTLTATIAPENASDKTLRWNSSAPWVASVEGGVVTALSEGSTTITVFASRKMATCQVSVSKNTIDVTSITLDKNEITLEVGKQESLVATVLPENATDKSVSWTSSDEGVATVDEGVVTAIAEGSATITATAGGFSATCTVTVPHVYVPVESISLSKTELTLEVGGSATLTATVLPENADDAQVAWSTSNKGVVTVTDGVVTGVAAGSATITAQAGTRTATCKVTVNATKIAVTGVTLEKTSLELNKGQSATLVATLQPADATDKAVSWISSAPEIASVDAEGQVKALAEGSANITVRTHDGGFEASCTVTVKEAESGAGLDDYEVEDFEYPEEPETPEEPVGPTTVAVSSVSLNKTDLSLEEGESETLKASVLPANATDKAVSWSSSATSTASVSDSGLVKAIAEGTATITVRTHDGGFEASCTVTVTKKSGGSSSGGGTLDDYETEDFEYPEEPGGDEPGGGDVPQDWTVEENYDTTPWLATSSEIESFLENVTYTDDFTVTHVTDYTGGPGTADIPPSYTVSWTSRPEAGALTLRLSEGSWSQEFALSAGASEKSLTNLVPGREYQYEVTSASSGKALAKGSFITTGRLHQVYFTPNVRNGRDLGGWTAAGGKTVAYRKIYRGGRLDGSYMNSSGKAEMRAFGIKAEIDLRYDGDGVASSSPLGSDIDFFAPKFEGGYQKMIQDNPEKVAACFTFIVQCLRQDKPVYFHCLAGRDRTGTLSMLLLGLLGVETSDLRKDYELTYFAPEYWSLHNGTYEHASTCWSFRNLFKILKDTGKSTVQEQIEKLLLDNGVSQQDINDFRSLMLE